MINTLADRGVRNPRTEGSALLGFFVLTLSHERHIFFAHKESFAWKPVKLRLTAPQGNEGSMGRSTRG